MTDTFNKKLSEMLGKMDQKVLNTKINKAMEMLQKESPDELLKKMGNIDRDELMEKLNEFDPTQLKGMNFDRDEAIRRLQSPDGEKLKKSLGKDGDVIIRKLMDLLKS